MESEHREGDVGHDEVHVGGDPNQIRDPKGEEESRERRTAEEVAEPVGLPLHEPFEEARMAAPERVEEDAGEQAFTIPPFADSSAPEPAEEPSALSGEQGEAAPVLLEAPQSEVALAEAEREPETPRPPRKRPAKKRTAHKRTDKGRGKPAKKRTKRASAKRPAKKRKKSRA